VAVLVFNALGAPIWVGTWSAVGYLAGNPATISTLIYAQVRRYELYLLIALAVVALAVERADRDAETAVPNLFQAPTQNQDRTVVQGRRPGLGRS